MSASIWNPTTPVLDADILTVLADTSNTNQGDALLGVKLAVTGGIAKTQHGKNAETLHLSDVAVGDGGATDNTTAINALFAYAATINAVVYVDAGIYGFTGLLVIPNGMRGLIGKGGTLQVMTTLTGVAGLLLGGAPAGLTPVADCDIKGVIIDCNNAGNGTTTTVGIWGQNCTRVNIVGNRVINVKYGHGILLRNYIGSTEGGSNVIAYNFVQGTLLNQSSPSVDWFGISCDLEPIYTAPYTDATTQWRNLHLAPSGAAIVASTGSAYPDGNKIIGNRVIGGYYGLSLQSMANSLVALNNVYGNQRGISLQNTATGNLIEGNLIQENFSAGVHLAYGSENNVIRGNRVNTTLGGGEGLLQCYVGTKRNLFEDNDTYCSSAGNQYHIYVGVHASGNIVRKNRCKGTALRAYIAVESSFNTSETDPASYGYGKVFTNGVASEGTSGVIITDNIIDGSSAVPAIFLGQVNDGTSWSLTDIEISRNSILNSAHNYQLKLKEDTASDLNSLRMTGNRFNLSAALSTYLFPRGRAHFVMQRDNDAINVPSGNFRSFTDGDTTPSVGVVDNWLCVQTAPTSITFFDDGVDMQIITVKCDNQTTFVHDNAKLRLKGGVNAVPGSASAFMVFQRHSAVWFEITRNF